MLRQHISRLLPIPRGSFLSSRSLGTSSIDVPALQQSLKEKGVEYALASYVDIHGVPKSKMVPLRHLPRMLQGSELCTGAALDGVPQDVSDEEVSPVPDPNSVLICPWGKRNIAWFASNLYCQGQEFESCSRNIFRRILARAADMGYRFDLGIEPEFFLLKSDHQGNNEPLPIADRDILAKPAYDVRTTLDSCEILQRIVESMGEAGYNVYSFDHEDGIGQYEIDFKFCDGLQMADRFVFFRLLCSEVAHEYDPSAFASFMPKPFGDRAGSGAHYNMNLADLETGKNLFQVDDINSKDPYNCHVTELAYHFIGGIVKHLPAICAVVAPTVNSYKRLIKEGSMSGFTWAPIFACYGNNNRTNAIRIPLDGGRVELRAADSANNPYLGAAMVLAAGLEGIRERIDPGPPHRDNMYLKSPEELAALGVNYLPRTLSEAVDALEADPLTREVFGDLMTKTYVDFKRNEWEAYMNHVSDWERRQYLKFY